MGGWENKWFPHYTSRTVSHVTDYLQLPGLMIVSFHWLWKHSFMDIQCPFTLRFFANHWFFSYKRGWKTISAPVLRTSNKRCLVKRSKAVCKYSLFCYLIQKMGLFCLIWSKWTKRSYLEVDWVLIVISFITKLPRRHQMSASSWELYLYIGVTFIYYIFFCFFWSFVHPVHWKILDQVISWSHSYPLFSEDFLVSSFKLTGCKCHTWTCHEVCLRTQGKACLRKPLERWTRDLESV